MNKIKSAKYYYNVIPVIRLPLLIRKNFTYYSLRPLDPGSLVQVEFRSRKIHAIITERIKKNKPQKFKFKKISKMIYPGLFTQKQLDITDQIAGYYFVSRPTILNLTWGNKKAFVKSNSQYIKAQGKFKIKKKQISLIKKVLRKIENKKQVLLIEKDRINIYLYLISKILGEKKQVLFLVPDLFLIDLYFQKFSQIFGSQKISVLNKKKNPKGFFVELLQIRENKKSLIIGTRSAVLANFNNLGLIIIDEAQDHSFKQWDQNPRYCAKKIAKILADNLNIQLILGTNSPSVCDYHKFQKNKAIIKSK
ncbi:MAG: hypothetical protein GF335_04520 [Candidatus Moranbacteria bacterium]|nr:hypothetical protein [Candidatus Moranbacteria bacterium]